MIRRGHSKLSIVQQCKLLTIHRSGIYYKPKGESELNLELMRLMDEHYLHHPFKGAARMHLIPGNGLYDGCSASYHS